MLPRLFIALTEKSPKLKRWAWRRWYQHLAGYRMDQWHFMNYGYQAADDDHPPLALDEADEFHRLCIQLYHHVASAIDLRGRDVLEVGSGRGGGASYVARYLHPRSMTGVDYSAKAVRFCQRVHAVDGLEFVQGDAEDLPFSDESFDAVINVESSHCYGSMDAFLAEVRRVLRPGGHFLFADLRPKEVAEDLRRQLEKCGLEILQYDDITGDVLRALELDSDRKRELIRSHVKRKWLVPTIEQFAGLKGSMTFEGFRTRDFVYKRGVLRKGVAGHAIPRAD